MTQKYLKSRWRSVVNGICMDEAGKRSQGIMNKGLANPFFFFSKLGKWKAFPENIHWQLLINQYSNSLLPKLIYKIDLFEKKSDS